MQTSETHRWAFHWTWRPLTFGLFIVPYSGVTPPGSSWTTQAPSLLFLIITCSRSDKVTVWWHWARSTCQKNESWYRILNISGMFRPRIEAAMGASLAKHRACLSGFKEQQSQREAHLVCVIFCCAHVWIKTVWQAPLKSHFSLSSG